MIKNVDEIRNAAPILEVVRQHVDLQRKGSNYIGLCPFHDEKTPSFTVTPSKNIFKCFGCGEGGDAVHFLMEHKNLTFPEALEEAARHAHTKVEYNGTPKQDLIDRYKQEKQEREAVLIQIKEVAKAYYQNVFDHISGLDLVDCEGRQYPYDLVKKFGLSWAPKNYISKIFVDQQWNKDLLIKAGIIRLSDADNRTGGGLYDFFRDRLLFPIFDHRGRVVGFAGRLSKHAPNQKTAKYINSPETIAFKKDEILYGLHQNKRLIKGMDGAFLVEGYTDVITMHQHGFPAVATCGTAFTFKQAQLLKRFTDNVIILRDGDQAGMNAAVKDVITCVQAGLQPKILFLPDEEDPDSFLRHRDKADFVNAMERDMEDAIIWRIMKEWSDDPFQREKAFRIAGELLAHIDSSTLRETYIRELTKNSRMGRVKQILKEAIEEYQKQNLKKDSPLARDQQDDVMNYGIYIKSNKYFVSSQVDNEGIAVSNFIVKPIMLVIGSKESQQLVEICNEYGRSFIMNLDRKVFSTFQLFKTETERMGNFIFTGKPEWYDRVKAKIYNETEDCFPIRVMGLHKEGFYTWGNGISINGKFKEVDEYGIVDHEKVKYFLPAFSKVQASLKGDDMEEEYEFEKKFRFFPQPACISFDEWTRRMYEVFGHNGTMGVAWAMASLFRDIIFTKFQFFPHLNLFGPSGSGKTFMARSIMSIFGQRNSHDPFNLASGTPVAFKRRLAQVSNGVIWFDEYSNDIDFRRVEALKGAYDGAGHETGVRSNDNRTKTTKVKSAVLVSGQQQPTKDIALFKRCITVNFKAGTNTLERQIKAKELNEIEQSGQLTQIVQAVMQYRDYMEENFSVTFEKWRVIVNKKLEDVDQMVEDRIVNNHLIPFTVAQMLASKIDFGFDLDELYKFTIDNIIEQSNSIYSEDELSVFWMIFEYLYTSLKVQHREDFIVEEKTSETYQNEMNTKDKSDSILKEYDSPKKLLYIRFTKVHPEYQERHQRQRQKTGLDREALKYYLRTSPAYMGKKRQKKFGDNNYSCYVFDIDVLGLEIPLTISMD
jgi:DNA primase